MDDNNNNNNNKQKQKTMKATTLQKRLEKLNLKKNTIAYKIVIKILTDENFATSTIRTCWTSGSGRYTTNLCYTDNVLSILREIGIKFEWGNDAPRGGLHGDFIKILTKIEF